MVGGNLLKNGLFYFRDPTHHNWVSKNIQKGQRGEQNSTIIIIIIIAKLQLNSQLHLHSTPTQLYLHSKSIQLLQELSWSYTL